MNKITLALTISVLSATSSIAQTSPWVYFKQGGGVEAFIDPSSRKTYGYGEEGITILWNFGEGTRNSRVPGESQVETIIFECNKSKMKFSSSTWYELADAKGDIVEKERVNRKWYPIRYNYILLFAKICVGG